MSEQYDYERRLNELSQGIDITFKNVLEPFIYSNISEYIKNAKTSIDIIDVGCGCGYLSYSIASIFTDSRTEGIDISEFAIKCAKSHFNLKFSQVDVVQINENERYDVVVYNMVSAHSPTLHQYIQAHPRIHTSSQQSFQYNFQHTFLE